MRVATIDVLLDTIAELYPITFSPHQRPAFLEQYRSVLSGLSGDELNDAWHFRMQTWKKKSGPTAADILECHRALGAKKSGPKTGDGQLSDRLKRRDEERLEDRRNLIERYQSEHAKGYEMARVEGWLGYLEEQVKRAANMISQRNETRRRNLPIADWVPEFCDIVLTPESSQVAIDRVERFVPWFSIVTVDGIDHIEIAQHTLKVWRTEAAIPGPARKAMPPSRSSTFDQVGAAA